MFGREEIATLQLRKRALVVESELNRLALQAEWQHVCKATSWMGHVAQFWRQASPWLALLAPLAGVLTARTACREGGIIGRLAGLLKWIQPLTTIWRSFMGTRNAESPAKPGVL